MTVAYATVRHVYDLGLTAQAFVVRPRPLDARAGDYLDPDTGTFRLIGHGLAADDRVQLVRIASGGALPGGASALQVYRPLPIDYWRFQLSLTPGGDAVTFVDVGQSTANGASSWGIQVDPERRLERLILSVSSDIDQDLTAHSTPIEADPETGEFPEKLVGITARVVARRAVAGLQFENPAFKAAAERLFAEEKRDDEQRAAWRLGQPIYPTPLDQSPTIADNAFRAANRDTSSLPRSAVPWYRGGML